MTVGGASARCPSTHRRFNEPPHWPSAYSTPRDVRMSKHLASLQLPLLLRLAEQRCGPCGASVEVHRLADRRVDAAVRRARRDRWLSSAPAATIGAVASDALRFGWGSVLASPTWSMAILAIRLGEGQWARRRPAGCPPSSLSELCLGVIVVLGFVADQTAEGIVVEFRSLRNSSPAGAVRRASATKAALGAAHAGGVSRRGGVGCSSAIWTGCAARVRRALTGRWPLDPLRRSKRRLRQRTHDYSVNRRGRVARVAGQYRHRPGRPTTGHREPPARPRRRSKRCHRTRTTRSPAPVSRRSSAARSTLTVATLCGRP